MSTPSEHEELLIVPVPSLIATLLAAQDKRRTPLTEEDVLRIRDAAPAIAMPLFAYEEVTAVRGYRDIDPENAWEEWQDYLNSSDSSDQGT